MPYFFKKFVIIILFFITFVILTRRGTNVLITRRGTNLQICTVGDYSRSDGSILKNQTDSDTESTSLSPCRIIFTILQSLWEEPSVNHQRKNLLKHFEDLSWTNYHQIRILQPRFSQRKGDLMLFTGIRDFHFYSSTVFRYVKFFSLLF